MSKYDDRLVCDKEGCEAPATMECGCGRCGREAQSLATEAFHACSDHQDDVAGDHHRMRGRFAQWYGILPKTETVTQQADKPSSPSPETDSRANMAETDAELSAIMTAVVEVIRQLQKLDQPSRVRVLNAVAVICRIRLSG